MQTSRRRHLGHQLKSAAFLLTHGDRPTTTGSNIRDSWGLQDNDACAASQLTTAVHQQQQKIWSKVQRPTTGQKPYRLVFIKMAEKYHWVDSSYLMAAGVVSVQRVVIVAL